MLGGVSAFLSLAKRGFGIVVELHKEPSYLL